VSCIAYERLKLFFMSDLDSISHLSISTGQRLGGLVEQRRWQRGAHAFNAASTNRIHSFLRIALVVSSVRPGVVGPNPVRSFTRCGCAIDQRFPPRFRVRSWMLLNRYENPRGSTSWRCNW